MSNTASQRRFWKEFTESTWEKKPKLIKNFISSLNDIKEEQIFLMLVEYSNFCRKIKKTDGFKLYIDGQQQHPEDVLQFLPVKKDISLKGYNTRMEVVFSDYCLVCDELLQVSQENLKKLSDFTDNLFMHIGFPNRFAEMGLYLGNYRKTPFGVHVDGCGVFSFPVVGEKKFRLWKPEFVKKNPTLNRADDYSKFKRNSIVLKAFPGDMTYWPSSAWHIAESDGSFSATWSLGVWVDKTHQENVEEALRPLFKFKLAERGAKQTITRPMFPNNKQPLTLPENYLHSISVIKKISKNELHDTFMRTWIKLNSKQGFKNSPQFKPQPNLSLRSFISIVDSQCILWSNLKSTAKTLYAFQGNVIESAVSLNLHKLILQLNTGKSCLISDYLKNSNKNRDLKTLTFLSNAGAFLVTAKKIL